MRILVVSNMYPSPSAPSFGIFVKRISEQMAHGDLDLVLSVRQLGMQGKIAGYLNFYWKTLIECFKNFDCVYIHFATHSAPSVMLARLFKRFPIVVHVHGSDLAPDEGTSALKQRIVHAIANYVLKKSNLIVAPSPYFKQFTAKNYDIPLDKIVVSPSGGVDIEKFAFDQRASHERKRFLFLSRLVEGKGVLKILPSMSRVAVLYPKQSFEVIIAGDGPLRERIRQQLEDIPMNVHVELPGHIEPENVPALMQKCHIFLFPSYRAGESLGLVALEGMACGKPVVAAKNGTMEEIVEEGVNGFLFDIDEEQSIDQAIEKALFLDEQSYTNACLNARRTAEKFSSRIVGDDLNRKLRSLIKELKRN